MSENVIKSRWNREKRAVKKNRWHVRGCYRLVPIIDGDSISSISDLLRNLRLIKIVDSPMQLTVTRPTNYPVILSSKASVSLLRRSRILRERRFEKRRTHTLSSSLSHDLENRFPVSISEASKQLYHRAREAIPGHSSLRAAARYCDGRIELLAAAWARSGAERARGPMFISWAVTSYQSNGARCDFSQGISVCLIEIPYPDPPGLPGSSYANGHSHTPLPPPALSTPAQFSR